MTRITTNRLIINNLSLKDSLLYLHLVNSDEWIKYIGPRNINSISEAQKAINKIINTEGARCWTISLKENKIPIGIITFIKRDYLELADFGFALLPNFYKMGYAFEASVNVIDYLNKNENIKEMMAITLPTNNSSINLLKKLGFNFLKEFMENNEKVLLYKLNLK